MEWQFDDERAIYTQLVEQIERAIATGQLAPGSRLPGVRELASDAGVNPNTMQRALAELETRGLVYTQRTSGRFVSNDATLATRLREEMASGQAARFVADMRAIGCGNEEIEGLVKKALITKEENE